MKNLLWIVPLTLSILLPAAGSAQNVPNDVAVTFTLCTEGTINTGDVCITGNNDAITNWGSGVALSNAGGDLWNVTIVFPSGTPAEVRYKYRRNDCVDWENDPDRSLVLPTDGTTTVQALPESFNRVTPIGCGFSSEIATDVTVCFQLCLTGITSTGGQCVIGNVAALGSWGSGLPLVEIGTDLYQHCVTFPAGTVVPLHLQYKFQKDDCATWENVDASPFVNRELRIEVSSPAVITATSTWGNEPGTCDAVPLDAASWGTLKSRYEH